MRVLESQLCEFSAIRYNFSTFRSYQYGFADQLKNAPRAYAVVLRV